MPDNFTVCDIGIVYGNLTIVDLFKKNNRTYANCQCSCGKKHISRMDALKSGATKSCGCKKKTHGYKHGLRKTKVYEAWDGMIQRCTNQKAHNYKYYGGRGITVCYEWKTFINFYTDMGDCLQGLSLERINVNGNYEPSNCTWIPKADQLKNTRRCLCNKKEI